MHKAYPILTRLNDCGYEAFIVGGAVRDALRHVSCDDIDITTTATPDEIVSAFPDHHVILTGIQHGTVTVMRDHIPFEVTTYRTDGEYSDHRHPDRVIFTRSLEEDLARRDFTVNAMAFHPQHGTIDPFGGQKDLENRILRCVGDPYKRFEEDALRIARLLRFSSVLSFDVEDRTADAVDALCHLLAHVAAERKRVELTKMLTGDGFLTTATRFYRPLCCIVPTLQPLYGFNQHTPYHEFDIYEHTVRAVAAAPKDVIVRLAVLLHDIGKPDTFTLDDDRIGHFYNHAALSEEMALHTMKELRFDNATIKQVLPLIHHHGSSLTPDKRCIKRRLQQLGEEGVRRLIEVKTADALACKHDSVAPDFSETKELLDRIIQDGECVKRKSLAVNGHDLIAAGVPRGPLIGAVLDEMTKAVINDQCDNTKDALMTYFKERW